MSSNNTVLPPVHRLQPLADWAKQNLTAVITATSDDEFKTAFDQFVSEHVKKIVLNDREITREEYRSRLQKERVNLIGATINIHDVVEVPKLQKGGEANETAGNVGLFYNAVYREGPRPVNPNGPNSNAFTPHAVRSSLNIEVEQDSTVRGPVFEERRRVFKLNQVYLEEPIGIEAASA